MKTTIAKRDLGILAYFVYEKCVRPGCFINQICDRIKQEGNCMHILWAKLWRAALEFILLMSWFIPKKEESLTNSDQSGLIITNKIICPIWLANQTSRQQLSPYQSTELDIWHPW